MRLRTQLLLAFMVLAVLPLTVIVLYSYATSLGAFRRAVAREADQLAHEMEGSLDAAEADLQARLERIGTLPDAERFFTLSEDDLATDTVMAEALDQLGEVAFFVDGFEVIPSADAPLPPKAAVEIAFTTEPIEVAPAPPAPPGAPAPEPEGVSAVAGTAAPAPETDSAQLEIDEAELSRRIEEALAETEKELEQLGREMELGHKPTLAKALVLATEAALSASAAAMEATAGELKKLEVRRVARERLVELERVQHRVLGRELDAPIVLDGERMGRIRAEIDPELLLATVLGRARREQGDIPFALDTDGKLYVADPADREQLEELPLDVLRSVAFRHDLPAEGETTVDSPAPGSTDLDELQHDDWILGSRRDPETGLVFGIARPVGDSLQEIRRTAVRNLGWGLALVGLALLGILPLSARMSSSLAELTAGAETLAGGRLDVEVPVRSSNEVGQLARAFNKMAHDLQGHQVRLLAEERRRREEEMDRRLLEAEHARKTHELEEARAFQLSLLPSELPAVSGLELAVHMSTATEVGGDYYDFRTGEDGSLTVAVGDATGHGARAGTMVTILKSLFASGPEIRDPAGFLGEANLTIRRMQLGRMAMAFTLARVEGRAVRLAAAGMPPVLLHRQRENRIEEVALEALPLGSLPEIDYPQVDVALEEGDTLLLMSDGLPELLDPTGEPLGYDGVRELFARAVGGDVHATISALRQGVEARTLGHLPSDDVTLVALRVLA